MMKIVELKSSEYNAATDIFTEAFADDPLFVMAFPEQNERMRCTKIMYEFVLNAMVPILNLNLVGSFENDLLTGCLIYSGTDSMPWSDKMNEAITEMRAKAANERINLIGEFAMLSGFEPESPCVYGNELAVKKEFRRNGIGSALCNELIRICNDDNEAEGILIDTANEKNLKLYESLGWELKLTLPFYEINKYFLWRKK